MPAWLHQLLESFRRYRSLALHDRRLFALAFVLMIGVVVSNAFLIWYLGQPFDALSQGRFDRLPETVAILAGIVIVNQLFHWSTTVVSNDTGLRFVGRLRNAALANIMRVSFAGVDHFSKGDLLARLSHDINGVQRLLIETPLMLWSHFLTFSVYCAMLWWLHQPLALLALALTPLFLLHQAIFNPFKRRYAQEFLWHHGRLLGHEEQTLEHLRGISTFNAQTHGAEQHRQFYASAKHWAMKERRLDALFTATFSLVIYGSGLAILYAGLHAVESRTLVIGSLLSFLLYLGYLSVPIRGVVQLSFQSQADIAGADRVWEILRAPPVVQDTGTLRAFPVQGHVEFRAVDFAYENRQVFGHVNLQVPAGNVIALVGPSGSGKSTFAKLLLRFYDPSHGVILVDGEDIRHFALDTLRRNITVVWQNPLLFNDTLRANLLLARAEAGDSELEQACRDAFAWEFIAQWPQGLDTPLGAGGIELSSGQAQRIAIAQGFLRDAPVLILDEPSSALDSDSERQIVAALSRLRRGRTTFIIAHRYSSVRNADSVIYFNGDGSLLQGTHEELLQSHAGYRDAVHWQLQSQVGKPVSAV